MKLTPFLTSLIPTFSKSTLETEFEELQKIITLYCIPYLESGKKQLGRYKFSVDYIQEFEDDITHACKLKSNQNFIVLFLDICYKIRDQFSIIQQMVDEYFEEDNTVHAMTLQRINLLQYIPILMFVGRYIRSFTNYALGLEINVKSEAGAVYDLIPAERQWLTTNRTVFFDSVEIVMHRGTKIEQIFEDLPDMSIDPSNVKIIEHTQGIKADPMGFGLIPLSINPFFWVGKIVVNYQTERYHLAKAEYDMLNRKLYNLRMISEGRNDARLQKEIKYIEEERVNPLKEKIAGWEEEYVNRS